MTWRTHHHPGREGTGRDPGSRVRENAQAQPGVDTGPQSTVGLAAVPRGQRRRWRTRETGEGQYDRSWARAARWMLARGVHPNHFTLLQVPVFALQVSSVVAGWKWTFVLLILFVIILDGGDGILARVGNLQSKTGAVLDALFDTIGIVIVLVGAAAFVPWAQPWLLALLVGNFLLLVQNALLDHKAIAYLRGPILIGVAIPETMFAGLVISSIVLGFLLAVRTPTTVRALTFKA